MLTQIPIKRPAIKKKNLASLKIKMLLFTPPYSQNIEPIYSILTHLWNLAGDCKKDCVPFGLELSYAYSRRQTNKDGEFIISGRAFSWTLPV